MDIVTIYRWKKEEELLGSFPLTMRTVSLIGEAVRRVQLKKVRESWSLNQVSKTVRRSRVKSGSSLCVCERESIRRVYDTFKYTLPAFFFFKGEGLSVDSDRETDSEDKDVAEADVLPLSLQWKTPHNANFKVYQEWQGLSTSFNIFQQWYHVPASVLKAGFSADILEVIV